MKLISTLIAIAFASTLSFSAAAAQHMGAAPAADAPVAAEKAQTKTKTHKAKKAKTSKKTKKAKKEKAMTGDAAAK